jgi:uncharacterized protein
MATITYFEYIVEDLERAKKFYGDLFGWKFRPFTDEYVSVDTYDLDGMPGLAGGLMKRQHPEHKAVNYITVEDLDKSALQVVSLGGSIIVPKATVPGVGQMIHCMDCDGNVFSLWKALPAEK